MRFPWLCLALSLAFLQAGCADSTETVKGLPVYCLDQPDPGPCGDRQTMYYYDYRTDSCRVWVETKLSGNPLITGFDKLFVPAV